MNLNYAKFVFKKDVSLLINLIIGFDNNNILESLKNSFPKFLEKSAFEHKIHMRYIIKQSFLI